MRPLSASVLQVQRACLSRGKQVLGTVLTLAAIATLPLTGRAQGPTHTATPITPIQHVIVVFGENRSFDHVFGTYVPKAGQTVWNLLSQGIVNADGTPGPNYFKAHQNQASDTELYTINPTIVGLYSPLPDALAGGDESCSDTSGEPFCTSAVALSYEPNMDPVFQPYLITGATGLVKKTPDTRITDYSTLSPGPFQLTNALPPATGSPNGSTQLTYDSYAASPVHRFYQMWQQTDCGVEGNNFFGFMIGPRNACASDLFPWVEVSIGTGSNGSAQLPICNPNDITTPCFSLNYLPGATTTGEGSASMGFYNAQFGDNPYLTQLANQYTLLDNMHQSIMGGTGANHIALGYADAMWYNGSLLASLVPPPISFPTPTVLSPTNTPNSNQIENPNPEPGTNNWYAQDGYSGGSYTECSDRTQPGVATIANYLQWMHISPHCDDGHYYLLNNYNPAYNGDGTSAVALSQFTIPPTAQPHIGDVLGKAGLTYYFFGEDWNIYAGILPGTIPDYSGQNPRDAYCNICNVFQYAQDIMTNPAERAAHIADMTGPNGFYTQLAAGNLPNVSIIQPSGFTDGHPATSKLTLWAGFVKNIIESVEAVPAVWQSTAIILIFDEGGGYYDSGYIQPIDFFGDGTRMPSLIVSPYTQGGKVYHGYADHVSIDKFIERNWNLPTISERSRDRLPNPITIPGNPYVPVNGPALDDLFGAFTFNQFQQFALDVPRAAAIQ